METKTVSVTAAEILEKIKSAKGEFIKASWKSNPKPAAAHKNVLLEKQTVGVVRAGINYANLSAVKQGIEEGTRGPVEELPWGSWSVDSEGKSLFPYLINHKNTEYIRLYPSEGINHVPKSIFFVNGEEVTKEEFAKYLTPSEARKLLEPKEEDKPLCFTIKMQNLLPIVLED